jgi:hypothetical protein
MSKTPNHPPKALAKPDDPEEATMKQQMPSSIPTSAKGQLELLKNMGRGDGEYAKALRHGLKEERQTPGQGRAIFMSTMKLQDKNTQ